MRKGRDGGKKTGKTGKKRGKKKKKREKTDENRGHYVIASSRPPERRRLERRTLAPKMGGGNRGKKERKHQPSGEGGTRSLPGTPHRLQNPKWPPGGPKMADGVWKRVYSLVFGRFKQLALIKFFDPSTPL